MREKIFTKEDFWAEVTENAKSDIHKLYLILSVRGFELKYEDDNISVINYNGDSDKQYLSKLLEENKIGCVISDKLVIKDTSGISNLEKIIAEGERQSHEATWSIKKWSEMSASPHIDRVSVGMLECYVARFVMALNKCKVVTEYSCDGNHESGRKVIISTQKYSNRVWFNFIAKELLSHRFNLDFDDTIMRFRRTEQFKVYYNLYLAAEFLYKNQNVIKSIYDNIYEKMKSYVATESNETLETMFNEYAKKELERITFAEI